MSKDDPDRVAIPRNNFHVCSYRRGNHWHFVLIFPALPYFEWDSWLDGGWNAGYHTAKDAEVEGRLHLNDAYRRLQAEGELNAA